MATQQMFHIKGMHCVSCGQRVEQSIQALDSVQQASLSFATQTLGVQWRTTPHLEEVETTVATLGYQATPVISPAQQYAEQQQATQHTLQRYKRTVWWMSSLTLLLLYISMGSMVHAPLPSWLSPHHPVAFISSQLILTLPIMWLGRQYYQRGFITLWQRQPEMDSLIALGTSAAFLQGVGSLYNALIAPSHTTEHPEIYFESVAVILCFISIGRYLEFLAKGRTSTAVHQLLSLAPTQATRQLADGTLEVVTPDLLEKGDHVLVRPGERVPIDGTILSGTSALDEAMLTGESLPHTKSKGDIVYAASVNIDAPLIIVATHVGQQSLLDQIIQLVQTAQSQKAPIARLADRVAHYFVPIIIVLALFASVSWWLSGASIAYSLNILTSVLIIACPCALGLATPTAIIVGTGHAAQHGVLFKRAAALETIQQVDTIVLDKTGTLTEGQPTVTDWLLEAESDVATYLTAWIAGAEQQTTHPLAQAITTYVAQHIETIAPHHATHHLGKGIEATFDQQQLLIGNTQLVAPFLHTNTTLAEHGHQLTQMAKTVLYIVLDQQLVGLIGLMDALKPSSQQAVHTLQAHDITLIMATGDHPKVAQQIAQQAGIEQFVSEQLPQDKVQLIQTLQSEGKCVMMVGDGINDAPALTQANIGVAIGSGTDIAIESGDLILMQHDLTTLAYAIRLSQRTVHIIKQNLFWAFAYNLLGIPIAMGGLALFNGPLLNPMFAALAMSLSSVSVLFNTLRLKRALK